MNNKNDIISILKMKTIAVVGASNKKERPSYFVSKYMHENGYKIIPINPFYKKIENNLCYPDLESISMSISIINIFRKSEFVLPIVQSSIKIGAKAIWMQDGVINREAEKIAKSAGLLVVMDDCLLRQHRLNHRTIIQ